MEGPRRRWQPGNQLPTEKLKQPSPEEVGPPDQPPRHREAEETTTTSKTPEAGPTMNCTASQWRVIPKKLRYQRPEQTTVEPADDAPAEDAADKHDDDVELPESADAVATRESPQDHPRVQEPLEGKRTHLENRRHDQG